MQVGGNQTAVVTVPYIAIRPVLNFNSLNNFTFIGGTGATYRVEFATNLSGIIQWTPLTTQTLSAGSVTITNLGAGSATNKLRFFRTVLLP